MMRAAGAIAVMLIAGLPVLVQPTIHFIAAGAVTGTICGSALLVPSLGLAVFGAVSALLVFAASTLLASSAGAILEATLLGAAVLTLFDATYFEKRLRASEGKATILGAHLSYLLITILLSIGAAIAIAVLADNASLILDPRLRPVAGAFGGILVLAAMVRRTLS